MGVYYIQQLPLHIGHYIYRTYYIYPSICNIGPITYILKTSAVGAHLHMDYVKINNVGFFLYVDSCTNAAYPIFVEKKSEAPESLLKMIKFYSSYNHEVKQLTSDPAGENTSAAIGDVAQAQNVRLMPCGARQQYRNGVVEGKVRRLKDMMRCFAIQVKAKPDDVLTRRAIAESCRIDRKIRRHGHACADEQITGLKQNN